MLKFLMSIAIILCFILLKRPHLDPPQMWQVQVEPEMTPAAESAPYIGDSIYDGLLTVEYESSSDEGMNEISEILCWWAATGGAVCWIDGKPVRYP